MAMQLGDIFHPAHQIQWLVVVQSMVDGGAENVFSVTCLRQLFGNISSFFGPIPHSFRHAHNNLFNGFPCAFFIGFKNIIKRLDLH